MNVQVSGHHVEVTPAIRDYVLSKLERVQRHFDQVIDINVILSVQKLRQKAEISVHMRGKDIHVESDDEDMYAAIDLVTDKLVRRVKKYHDKVHGKTRHGHEKIVAPTEPAPELAPVAAVAAIADEISGEPDHASDNGRIVKTKQFALKPMSVREATLQLELVGHDFFVFTNAESNRTNVVYRRNDGHYGLIEPAEN